MIDKEILEVLEKMLFWVILSNFNICILITYIVWVVVPTIKKKGG